jgi:hypothetical protein
VALGHRDFHGIGRSPDVEFGTGDDDPPRLGLDDERPRRIVGDLEERLAPFER